MKGIDISMHNNNINFAQVKNAGINVVIIKATEGVEYVDPFLNQHYQGAKAQNLNIGFYHFMSEKTSPSQQAVDFWNAIKGKQFNVIPCLDIETNNMGRSSKAISDRCIEFLTKFKSLSGHDCMIYTGGYFGRDNLDSRVKKYKGWIAHYGVNSPMTTGFTVVGHQYTEDGRINGISTRVDLNNFENGIFIGKATNAAETREMEIQNMLVTIGYPIGPSGIDGIIGNGTITAIKAFQKDCNLNIDGDVGSKTWDKLVYEYNKKLGAKPTQEEEFDMDKVVLYFGPLDALSAVLVSQKYQCPMMLKKDFEDKKLKAKEMIIIGGKPGTDRYDSFKDAAKLL
ncbi:GH25 family lysozyme [Clostridium botulinum]|uniref:GH25 family lysozyme n=1 Tax=Clostridium botulinum TaxID=1491 RepID=UPI0009B1BFD2|nr:GH25 family lysozyme [Clostridium botulinum]MCC5425839.1 peptidoglycan-binding protein [Clostridium botulinum]